MYSFVPISLPSFVDRRPAVPARRPAGVREEIWGLHSILANPAALPAASRRARAEMLRILDQHRLSARLRMIVPPLTVPAASQTGRTAGERLASGHSASGAETAVAGSPSGPS